MWEKPSLGKLLSKKKKKQTVGLGFRTQEGGGKDGKEKKGDNILGVAQKKIWGKPEGRSKGKKER